ncbi:hypothetical protein MYA83_17375 [Pseudomonas palleroniana]|uniref:hypothetical protein n=1 Tax=Pseudomonas palleroniana TaxID=191390 RepID=UPI003B00FF4C
MEVGDLKKLDVSLSTNVAIFFLSFIAPGFLIFYRCEPETFLSIDVSKLIVLALAISSPTFVFPFVFTALFAKIIAAQMPGSRPLWGAPLDWYLRHGVGNALNMYTIIAVVWIFDLGISFISWLILFTVILNLLVEVVVYCLFVKNPSNLHSVWFEPLRNRTVEKTPREDQTPC